MSGLYNIYLFLRPRGKSYNSCTQTKSASRSSLLLDITPRFERGQKPVRRALRQMETCRDFRERQTIFARFQKFENIKGARDGGNQFLLALETVCSI